MTDHAPLQWLAEQKSEGLLCRWALAVQEYDFSIVYRKGAMRTKKRYCTSHRSHSTHSSFRLGNRGCQAKGCSDTEVAKRMHWRETSVEKATTNKVSTTLVAGGHYDGACAESIGQAYLSAYRGTYILPSSMHHATCIACETVTIHRRQVTWGHKDTRKSSPGGILTNMHGS